MNTVKIARTLLNIPSIGRKRSGKILAGMKTDSDLFSQIKNMYPRIPVEPYHIEEAEELALRQMRESETAGIQTIFFRDSDYPLQLRGINEFPPLIHIRGNPDILNRPMNAALIGSRRATAGSLKMACIAGELLSDRGFTIISGLALGCDTMAHNTALKEKSYTIAVMPCGPDIVYPRQNLYLYNRIIESGSLVLSEYSHGVEPASYRFIERDRIQSGLSQIVVLIESRLRGGAMYAAFSALEQNRPLLVYRPEKFTDSYSGNRYLLKQKNVLSFADPGEFLSLLKNINPIIRDCNRETDQLLFPYA